MTSSNNRISFYLPSLNGGGAERVILDLAEWFASRGFCVDLLLLKKRGAYLNEVPPNVRLVKLKGWITPLQWFALIAYGFKYKPHTLLTTLIGCNVTASLAKVFWGERIRVVLREADMPSKRLRLRHFAIAWAYRLLIPISYPKADRIICVSEGVKADLTAMRPEVVPLAQAIANPTLSHRTDALMRERADHPWFDSDVPTLVSAGRLVPQKDYPTLLRAVALMREIREVRLILLGDGKLESELRALAQSLGIAEFVAFEGFQPNPFAYMNRADCYVLSSCNEGMPNVLIQALACGCPLVATDCQSGPREILGGGDYGKLVPVGDAPALAEAVLQTLEEPADQAWLKAQANRFRIDHIAPLYAEAMAINLADASSSRECAQ